MKELVTVIIPASRPETLGICLKAVRSNGMPVKVLIVRTVESNDIIKIAAEHGAEVCDFISSTAQHQAREYGLKRVETPYVHFLDDDDYIGSRFYEKALKSIQGFDATMTTPGIGVGLKEMVLSFKYAFVATNCSALVYRTDSIKRVFTQLPVDLNSCYECYLYNLVLTITLKGSIAYFSGGWPEATIILKRKSGIRILQKKPTFSGSIFLTRKLFLNHLLLLMLILLSTPEKQGNGLDYAQYTLYLSQPIF